MNTVIHRAVRRDLRRFSDALATFRDGDADHASRLGAAWDNFRDQLHEHHTGEHQIAWPALESLGVSRELLLNLDEEHDAMAAALTEADSELHALRESSSRADADSAVVAVRHLEQVTVAHLDHEEAEVEPVYLAHQDGPELTAMSRQFRAMSLPRAGRFFAWLTDGATPEERAAVTGTVPGPVFWLLNGLFGRDYRRTVATAWRS